MALHVRRYDLASLLAASGLTESGLTRRAGLSGSTLKNARENGLTEGSADRYAVRCGLHPAEVWSEWGHVPCHGCDQPFVPRRPTQRYCTANCSSAHRRRLRYATDPDYAERRRGEARALYEECGEYIRRRNRAWKSAA